MNSMVTEAVTTPSATHARKVGPGERGRSGPDDDEHEQPGPGQSQPGGALDADAVDQGHRDRQPDLHATASTPSP